MIYTSRNIATFVETLPQKISIVKGKVHKIFEHKFLSLAAVGHINNNYHSIFDVIQNDTEKEVERVMVSFVENLYYLHSMMIIPDKYLMAVDQLEDEIEVEKKSPTKDLKKKCLKWLKRQLKLQIFGYNSSSFDLKMIRSYLFGSLSGEGYEIISILLKGTNIFHLETEDFMFKDIMAYSYPCSMEIYVQV